MCEECEETEPLYVAYFGKAGGSLWRPPLAAASAPQHHDPSDVATRRARFVCDDANCGKDQKRI
jgi:hypothetical protein